MGELPFYRKTRRRRPGDPVISLVLGAPSLTIGIMAIVLLTSYYQASPIGPPTFYLFESHLLRPPFGGYVRALDGHVNTVVPSARMVGILIGGAWCGWGGIYFSRRQGQRSPKMAIAGFVLCGAAFVLTWLLILRSAMMETVPD